MEEPLVSVITPLYNREDLVAVTIESVLKQTYPHWEHIIVDDGSTDNSTRVVQSIAASDSRIKLLVRHRKPKGAPTCRNIGIENASGKYIIFLDSDDLLQPTCLENRVQQIEKYILDFMVFQGKTASENESYNDRLINIFTEKNDLARFIKQDLPWLIHGVIWKKKSLLKNELFWDESLPSAQDFKFHISAILRNMKYKKVKETDHIWNLHKGDRIGKNFSANNHLVHHILLHLWLRNQVIATILFQSVKKDLSVSIFQLMKRCMEIRKWRATYYLWSILKRDFEVDFFTLTLLRGLILISRCVPIDSNPLIRKTFVFLMGRSFYYKDQGTFLKFHCRHEDNY